MEQATCVSNAKCQVIERASGRETVRQLSDMLQDQKVCMLLRREKMSQFLLAISARFEPDPQI